MPAAAPDLFHSIRGAAHVVVAVSGGSDSMALLRLAASAGLPRLSALTVDHGLRPESAVEARQVAAWCESHGVPHCILRWEGEKPRTGLQAKARAARYNLMAAWCRHSGAEVLMTAHTLDDQAETVLMRLARTSSLDSLAGIPAVGQWQGVKVFRPLLGERRDALRDFLREIGQPWIDDPSNDNPHFERVRIRQALPDLMAAGVTPEGLAALATEAQAVTSALWDAAEAWIAAHANIFETGHASIAMSDFHGLKERLKSRVLALLVRRLGGGKLPEPAELETLAQWLAEDGISGRRTLGGAVIAKRKREILIGREAGRIDPVPLRVPETGQAIWDGRFEIAAAPGSRVVSAARAGFGVRPAGLPAFVQQALPVLIEDEGMRVARGFSGQPQGWARFRTVKSP